MVESTRKEMIQGCKPPGLAGENVHYFDFWTAEWREDIVKASAAYVVCDKINTNGRCPYFEKKDDVPCNS